MYSIYFNNRCLAVCSFREQLLNEPGAVLYSSGSESDLSDLPILFQNSPQLTKLYVPSDNEEATFKQLCTKFISIQAGGGLVTNRKGDYLLIFRHGVWDLPKGKQEPSEDIRQSALREVEEECGVHDLEIKEHICDTYHTYLLNGKFILKCTHWYKMEYPGNGLDTAPQTEEDIERAVWVKKEDLPKYLAHTYPSIKEVFALWQSSTASLLR
ncbi:MAG: NUDIX domain-containing protein [Bacteroidales bacterium]